MDIETLRQARDLHRTGEAEESPSPGWFSDRMDQWVTAVCRQHKDIFGSVLVLALGGYGRSELYPHSDIDLMVCLPDADGPDTQVLAEAIFLPLWDSGFDVGHGMRTTSENLDLARSDFEVLCSLLDARFLYGQQGLFAEFRQAVDVLAHEMRRDLVIWLGGRREERLRRCGDSVQLVSPHLKEGRGGQRDVQTIRWLNLLCGEGPDALGLTGAEWEALDRAASFVARTRVALHRISRRRNDIVHLEMQPELAQSLGYGSARERGSVEAFLSDLHRNMTVIQLLTRLCLDRARFVLDRPGLASAETGLDFSVLAKDPANILELFRLSARSQVPIAWQTRRVIQEHFPLLAGRADWQAAVAPRFQDLLCAPSAPHALEQMLEMGFLSLFLPEFTQVEHLVQFDAYHTLPAGPHLVETVRQLAAYGPEHDFLGQFLADRSQDPCLRWAALLHDIGKGDDDHALRGAAMSRLILARLGLDPAFIDGCAFLIEHHLLLVHTATRRDLGEESVIHGLAAVLGTVERLNALTLLTWADSVATGPKAWNPWIENLLRETYFKTRKVLEYGFLSEHSRVHRLSRLRDALRAERPEYLPSPAFEGYLAVMPPRYLMQTSSRRILEHVELVRRFQAGSGAFLLSWEHKPGSGALRLTLIATDRPGLFARVCAALARYHLSVLGAELCAWDDRTVVDVFWVTEPLDPLYVDQTVAAFESSLVRLFDNDAGLDRLSVSLTDRQKKVFALDQDLVRIQLDNVASDFHTVLSIQAPDVPGLLATVSLCLYRLGIDLVFAKIATQKDKAVDILHVREGGSKIPDAECVSLEQSLRLMICSLYV